MEIKEFLSSLFEIEVNIHIAHLQTTNYSEHIALNEVYTGIVDLRDRFIESYQGKYGVVKGYKSFQVKEAIDPVNYLKEFCSLYEKFRLTLEDGYLQQITDDILELFYSAIYKLKTLK